MQLYYILLSPNIILIVLTYTQNANSKSIVKTNLNFPTYLDVLTTNYTRDYYEIAIVGETVAVSNNLDILQ
jgi:hypothetical protein